MRFRNVAVIVLSGAISACASITAPEDAATAKHFKMIQICQTHISEQAVKKFGNETHVHFHIAEVMGVFRQAKVDGDAVVTDSSGNSHKLDYECRINKASEKILHADLYWPENH